MDKSAIEKIQESQALASANMQAMEHLSLLKDGTHDHHPFVILSKGDGEMGPLSLETYLPNRCRFRGRMKTSIIDDFVRFAGEYATEGQTSCFIDPDQMSATAIMNLGHNDEPGHGDFTNVLTLKETSEFKALTAANGNAQSQKDMAEWMEDWAENLKFISQDGAPLSAATAISGVRRMKIEARRDQDHEAQNFRNTRSTFESIEAKSDNCPHSIEFTCIPYQGLEPYTFEARLSVLNGGETPTFKLKIVRLEMKREEMSQDFMNLLEGQINSRVDTQIGIYRGDFRT